MFTMVVDETRAHLLQMMFNHCGGGIGSEHFLKVLHDKDSERSAEYTEELVSFLKEFAEKVHENNLCMDPDCQYGK